MKFVLARARLSMILGLLLILASGPGLSRASAIASTAGAQKATVAPPAVKANPADVESIDSIIAAVYDVISGPTTRKRDWDRFRSLFAPGARMIPVGRKPTGEYAPTVFDVDGYIARAGKYFETNGFFEKEVARRTEKFGHIAHVFSTYESRHKADDPSPFARGINSIQLMNDGKRWWVVNIFWEGESPENQIPKEYLNKPGR